MSTGPQCFFAIQVSARGLAQTHIIEHQKSVWKRTADTAAGPRA
jgi:hypothetical protein